MSHVVLLGDSIFDNERYVPGGPAVIDQLRRSLPRGWMATLLAVDGAVTTDVPRQLVKLPADATHLVVSVGGNDALGSSGLVKDIDRDAGSVLLDLADTQAEFARDYRAALRAVVAVGKPAVVCTVYDAIPSLSGPEQAGLSLFNDVIVREAVRAGVPVIDLRAVCDQAADYSDLSPIEPSRVGGAKIAEAIARVATAHDFTRRETVIYGRGDG
jgi:hypothetical protein